MDWQVFGIRHHGPGSARRLRLALEEWRPDAVLIEAPSDAQGVIAELVRPGMQPPVALVLYEQRSIENASFLPFAHFSPEYQAIDWARRNQAEIRLIDLPAQHYLARKEEEQLRLFQEKPRPTVAEKMAIRLRKDPLSLLAEIGGYADSERWWDATVERGNQNDREVFAALLEAVEALRSTYPDAIDEETMRREAYMREQLRKATKAGFERIAVIVGAWHGPAIADTFTRRASTDKALLKGLPKVKVKAAWIPWSYPRLSRNSGYGAGVVSPAWYELLFTHSSSATERWMVAAAQLLRKEGFDASPALAADGVDLAKSLAALRGQALAGTEELDQAVLSTLASGHQNRLDLIHQALITGTKVGSVPSGTSTVPLLADLRAELTSTRLQKWWEVTGEHYLKATKANPRGGIDLRQENDLRKSWLLHRLQLLGIPWGSLQPGSENAVSSFREIWLLEWQPEFSLLLTERSSYGNTLARAAGRYSLEKARELSAVDQLAELVLSALRAELPDIIPGLVRRLRDLASHSQDTPNLLAALPTLVSTYRYGDSRKTDTSALLLLIQELVPRLAGGLARASTNIDEEEGGKMVALISQADYALSRLSGPELLTVWRDGLRRLIGAAGIAPAVDGVCLRLLFDHGLIDLPFAQQHFSYSLSSGQSAPAIAGWIEGFLHGGSQLLLHYPPLWRLLEEWIADLEWTAFEGVLPAMRRCLADFSGADRRRIFSLVDDAASRLTEHPGLEKAAGSKTPIVTATDEMTDLLPALHQWMGN